MDMVTHHCRTCDRTPEQTAFRLNGSGAFRADCNECERTKQRMRRQTWRGQQPIDDTPQIADGYAMMPYQGAVIAWDTDGGMVCLTDLWRAAGEIENREPYEWLRLPSTQEYIDACRRQGLVTVSDRNDYSRRGGAGGGGGTWREKIVGLAYAQYLNADLYVTCNQFILEKWARSTGITDELLRAIAEHLGVLPRMEAKIDGIGQSLAGAERIETKQYHRGRIYIGLLTNLHMVELVRRDLIDVSPGALLVFLGQTKPGEGQERLRIRDYGGKVARLRPTDYEVLATFDTDMPDESERLLLINPPRGAVRAQLENHKQSLSFHIVSSEAIAEYRRLARAYYAVAELQATWAMTSRGPLQADMFSRLT